MKSLLIVEDEKLIRQGIKTMVQRSGVPVELILECTNGQMALETLKETHVDVMFTDIRMPKMDGIELVRRVHEEVENPPLMVAISGYDDFAYAVEMLRNGVREYILKPVEREKIVEILTTLDREISQKEENLEQERKIGISQLRYLLLTENLQENELALMTKKYEAAFFPEPYAIVCCSKNYNIEDGEGYFHIPDLDDGQGVVLMEKDLPQFLKNEMPFANLGLSEPHQGLAQLRMAYTEALNARKGAFCQGQGKQLVWGEYKNQPRPREELLAAGEKLLEESARMQRLQRIGTDKTEELENLWERFFLTARKGHISPEAFLNEMSSFLREAKDFYRNSLTDQDLEEIDSLSHILSYEDIEEYEEAFSTWTMSFHERINEKDDEDRNKQKMEAALAYVNENYRNDLNMAVVSNYISMNYTMFSYCFKQYTGKNFTAYLKDVRISEAKRLLVETDMKIIDISWEVGYENEKNFMKVFKSVCGVSPSEYRKNVNR